MNFFDRLREFMYGRYGIDDLQKFLIGAYVVSRILLIIFPGRILQALSVVILILFIVRFFSKDIYIRQKENRKYLEIKDKFINFKNNGEENRKYIFRTCPECKAKIRLPRKRGKHVCTCPRCGKDFDVRVII